MANDKGSARGKSPSRTLRAPKRDRKAKSKPKRKTSLLSLLLSPFARTPAKAGAKSGRKSATKPVAKTRKATATARKRSTSSRKPGLIERTLRRIFYLILIRIIWWVGIRTAVIVAAVVGTSTLYVYSTLPEASALLDGRDSGSVTFADRNGRTFAWRGEQYVTTRTETTSPHLISAVIATEDKRFFNHFGLDPRGIARAMVTNFRAGRVVQGGSTITQQVAKLLYFENTRSLERHIKQIPYVLAMEAKYSKEDILSIYLNRAYLGAGAQGFEAASQRYFNKPSKDITPAEGAMLAGLLKAPSRYAPTRDISAAQGRAGVIIGLMEQQGRLSRVDAELARANPAVLSSAAEARTGGYFADWVMGAGPSFLTKSTTEDVVIETTFDAQIQRAAEAALREVFDTKVREGSKAQAAIVVLSPDGAVRAMVGGRKTGTGSAFKPLVYGAGLEAGLSQLDVFDDAPLTINVRGSGPWSPKNYTRDYKGSVTMTEALRDSINTVAVRVQEAAGRTRVRALAADLGMTRDLANGPSLALGVSEVTLLEITGAYAQAPIRVLSERAAGNLVYMLADVVANGTGRRAQLDDRPAAGKTGTTQAARDAWFIGFTGDYVAGVWMGYDDNTPLNDVTGGGLPAEIWKETMERVHTGLPPSPLPMTLPQSGHQLASTLAAPSGDPEADTVMNRVLDTLFGLDHY